MLSNPHCDDKLRFGTIDTWLMAKLTGMESISTDSTNASRTMLMDLHTLEWSEDTLQMFDIKRSWLPEIMKSSSEIFGSINDPRC